MSIEGTRRRGRYNFLPYFQGKEKAGPRDSIYYFDQGGNLSAVRNHDWKVSFAVIREELLDLGLDRTRPAAP